MIHNASEHVNTTEDSMLKILSWNIKMLPAPYGWFFNRHKRANDIIQFFKDSDPYDIVFFQEAFSGSIRRKIYDGLNNIYPFEVEPEDQTTFYRTNSGLWVISRLPITLINQISFSHIRESDRLASKGAKLFSTIKDRQEFHIINTHMQSDYKTDYSDIRISQYTEINSNLIMPIKKSDIPLILCGDLNIAKTSKLQQMLEKLNLINGPLMGTLQHSIIGKNKEVLDYILVSDNHSKFKAIRRKIINFPNNLKGEKYNLSDHYPIEAIFSW